MKLTSEQQEVNDKVQETLASAFDTNVVVHVDAKAGTGKTTLVKHIVNSNRGLNFIYTAFNKKIVEDGAENFGEKRCKTFHALAYKYTHNPKVGGFYPNSIKEHLTYPKKKMIVDMLDKYCLSKHLDIDDFFKEYALAKEIKDGILKYLVLMSERKIYHTFNYMLKELHHQLADGEVKIDIDILFVDEAQDLTPVMLEVFGLIQSTVKIYLGDTSQDIYSFLDLVSAFTLSKSTYDLTRSFRLSPAIAERIEPFCKKHIDTSFRLVGEGTGTDTTEAFITHSNAEIIKKVYERQQYKKGYSFTRPPKEIFEVALIVNEILDHKYSKKPKYWELVRLVKKGVPAKQLAKSEELDDDIVNSIKLLISLRGKGIDVEDVLDKAEADKPDYNYLIGTAHSVKGLEFGIVKLSEGLNKYVSRSIETWYANPGEEIAEEEKVEACKLYYVAASRAKHTLNNANILDYV